MAAGKGKAVAAATPGNSAGRQSQEPRQALGSLAVWLSPGKDNQSWEGLLHGLRLHAPLRLHVAKQLHGLAHVAQPTSPQQVTPCFARPAAHVGLHFLILSSTCGGQPTGGLS